jgi:hypothetical protein
MGSLAVAMFLAARETPAPAPAPQAAAAAPDGAVARVNGQELPLRQFEEWLVKAHGWRHLDDYVDLALLRQESERLKLPLPSATELDAEFERDWSVKVEMRGDEAALLAELAHSGIDKVSQRDRQLGTIEQDFLGRRILALREPTEAMLKDLFAKEFGKAGVRTHVRIAFFDRLQGMKPGGTASKEAATRRGARAQAFHDAVMADRTAAALVPRATARSTASTRRHSIRARRARSRASTPTGFGALEKPLRRRRPATRSARSRRPPAASWSRSSRRGPVAYADVETELRAAQAHAAGGELSG